jgi:UDP-N-acetylmuramate dehydrogenase
MSKLNSETCRSTKWQSGVQLNRLTTFRIGGCPVLYGAPYDYVELGEMLSDCRERSLPGRIMGGGSNLLVDDGELPFAVIHICAPGFDWIEQSGPASIRAGAGVRLSRLLIHCRNDGLSGLEFLAGIPGTVGGALAGNAGAWGSSIGERLVRAWVLDQDGNKVEKSGSQIGFGYRQASFNGDVIAEAELVLERSTPELVAKLIQHYMTQKAERHPMGSSNAGCVFKNPAGAGAGKLLDRCGLKGRRVGGAEVSRLHANFICNVASASSRDVSELIETMRRAVLENFDVRLEMEIRHWSSNQKAA